MTMYFLVPIILVRIASSTACIDFCRLRAPIGHCERFTSPVFCGPDGLCAHLFFTHINSGFPGVCVENVTEDCLLGAQVTCVEADNLVEIHGRTSVFGAHTPTGNPSLRPYLNRPSRHLHDESPPDIWFPPSSSSNVWQAFDDLILESQVRPEIRQPPRPNSYIGLELDPLISANRYPVARLQREGSDFEETAVISTLSHPDTFDQGRFSWHNRGPFSFRSYGVYGDGPYPLVVGVDRMGEFAQTAFPFAIHDRNVLPFDPSMCLADSFAEIRIPPGNSWSVFATFEILVTESRVIIAEATRPPTTPERYFIDTLSIEDIVPVELYETLSWVLVMCENCELISGSNGRMRFENCPLSCFPELQYKLYHDSSLELAAIVHLSSSDYTVQIDEGVYEVLIKPSIHSVLVMGSNIFQSTTGIFVNRDTIAFCDPL